VDPQFRSFSSYHEDWGIPQRLFPKTDKINTGKQRCLIRGEDQAKPETRSTFGLLTLNNIIYNPEATINILSISKLGAARCKTTIDGGEMLITPDDEEQKIHQESMF
jgi:hypothetical protein